MGDFKEWYSTFLTDLPGGGVPLHKRRKGAADGQEAEQVRVGTPDYRSLVRDIHRVESLQRNKMRSLPELTRSPSPGTGRASRAGGAQSTMSSTSLPMLLETTDASRPSVGKCKTFLNTVLHPNRRRQTAQVLVLDGIGDRLARGGSITPDLAQSSGRLKKLLEPKHVPHPDIGPDDLICWQRGLLENVNGRAALKEEHMRRYDKDCLDVGLTLSKAKDLVKLLGVREKMRGQAEIRKKEVSDAVDSGQLASMYHNGYRANHKPTDFLYENKAETTSTRKEYRRVMLLHAASRRANRNLKVLATAQQLEKDWKIATEQKLTDKQERRRRRLLQQRWMPICVAVACLLKMQETLAQVKAFRKRMAVRNKAVTSIQRAYRATKFRRSNLQLSLNALNCMKRKTRCWLIHIQEVLLNKKADLVKKLLQEYLQSRSMATYLHKYRMKVVKCQRFIRAFNDAMRFRKKEMGIQWDHIAQDIIGNDSGKQWMHRLLNSAKRDENGKAVSNNDPDDQRPSLKDHLILVEIRKMRKEFLAKLDEYHDNVRVFRAKTELLGQMEAMGLDPVQLRSKLGILGMVPTPKMAVYAPRAVIRYAVEAALKQLGIMDFVDEMMYAELKERTDKIMDLLIQKFSFMLRAGTEPRVIFDEVDDDGNGTLEEEELKAFLDKIQVRANYQEVRILFSRLDFEQQGSLTYTDFMDRVNGWKLHGKEWEKKALANKMKKSGGTAEANRLRAEANAKAATLSRTSSGGSRAGGISRTPSGISRASGTDAGQKIARTTSTSKGRQSVAVSRTPSVRPQIGRTGSSRKL